MPTMPMPDDNYARRTNHDYIGSFGRIPNEPKSQMKYLPLAFVNWCKIDVFTLNVMALHHKKSNYQQQQKYKMIKNCFLLYE